MRFDKATVRVLVRKAYGECFDFYTEKLGLFVFWGDRNGPYTSFSTKQGEPPCFAIFLGKNTTMFKGYTNPLATEQPDTIAVVLPSDDLDADYERLTKAGVSFLGEPQTIEDWGMRCAYFRDPEGNLFELNDASGV